MDRRLIIDHWTHALGRVVAGLFVVAGLGESGLAAQLPRRVHLKVLSVLRPAESALRRLILVLSLEVVVALGPVRPAPAGGIPRGTGERLPLFRLIDPRKRFDIGPRRLGRKTPAYEPHISVLGWDDWGPERHVPDEPPAPSPDDPLDAARLCHRLLALKAALDDLPKQARRMARAEARERAKPRNVPGGPFRRVRLAPMRPGAPPGYRRRRDHPVDEVLHECHILALRAVDAPDTS